MTNGPPIRGPAIDLVALVPGKDEHETIHTLLTQRHSDLGIRRVDADVLVHPNRDPGCYHEAEEILRPYHRRAGHALVPFDHEGSGQEQDMPAAVAARVEERLRVSGWEHRAAVVVIRPELEAWLWASASTVAQHAEWAEEVDIPSWLAQEGLWLVNEAKPRRPKEAFQAVLRQARQRRSSAIYRRLAGGLPVEACRDPAFRTLRRKLREWFR